jgi:hypothetical protein
MPAKMQRAFIFSIVACAVALAGCSSETQQQKFVDAMNHGNSAQASQIWLHMDAQSRLDFSHSQGMQPDVSSDDVKKQVMQHYKDEVEKPDGGGEEGGSGQSVDNPAPMVHLGGLQSLPEWVGPSGAPPQAVTVPDMRPPVATVPDANTPSN